MTAAVVDEIRVPVERLLAAAPDADAAVERLRAVVSGGPPALTLLRVAASSIRRYDIWTRDDEVVTVPYQDDRSVVVPCGYAAGPLGLVLVGELLADDRPSPAVEQGPLRFDDVADVVRSVAAGAVDAVRATVLHSHAENIDLVRVSGPGSRWASIPTGQPIELTDAGEAGYWGRVLSALR